MGVPASHNPFLCGIFHYKASILGYPHLSKPPNEEWIWGCIHSGYPPNSHFHMDVGD